MKWNKEKIIKSPINYAGSKYRLLKKGLLQYFPEHVNQFIDLFCGTGNIGINVTANTIICNDYITCLIDLYNYWKNNDINSINTYINHTIKKHNLSVSNKESFNAFREYYNKTKNIIDLFILTCYSFNNQIRFNNKNEYNSSFGKRCFNSNMAVNLDHFINTIKEKDIQFTNYDFRELKIDKLKINDFVYADPPYLISCAVYQDRKPGWSAQDDIDLMNLLDKLDNKGIKFALSNMIESKGNVNNKLLEWSSKYKIIDLNTQYNNANYQRKNKDIDREVLIINY